jgi:hypothetical protein
MAVLYDVPAGKSAVIDGPAELRVHASSGGARYQVYNTGAGPSPAPVISSIAPTTAAAAAGSLVLDVIGLNFATTAVIVFNAVVMPTSFVSDTLLRATVSGTAGAKNVLVRDGAVDSNVKVFTFT